MVISLTHKFTSAKADGIDSTRIQPSNWNDEHDLELASGRLVGRTAAGAGPAQEISVSADLALESGTLGLSFPVTAYGKTLLDDADAATARATLGLGTIATQAASNVAITGGTGTFSTVDATNRFRVTAAIPIVELAETDAGNATHNRNRISRDANVLRISTVADNGTNVANDYEMTLGASGATAHMFAVNNSPSVTLNAQEFIVKPTNLGSGFRFAGSGSFPWPMLARDTAVSFADLGSPGVRWNTIYLNDAPNVSSDERLKENFAPYTETDLAAARLFQPQTFTISAQGKGSSGYVAQQIIAAFVEAGADERRPFELGLISDGEHYGVCYELVNALRIEALARSM
jgi:hypothetical protein